MSRSSCVLAALAASALVAFAAPASAQEEREANSGAASAGERITQVIVYGDDPCKPSDANEIVVCVRQAEKERYRIPSNLRGNPQAPESQAWLNRAQAIEYVGRSGTNSCSPTGAGGFTGCFAKIAAEAKEERKQMDGTDWKLLVEQERSKRLGNIDAESKEIEARVKAEEAVQKAAEEGEAATKAHESHH